MRDLLPITEILLSCETHAARADWLLTVPIGILLRDCLAIREILVAAGFELGVNYLDAECARLHCRRGAGGSIPFFATYTADLARKALADAGVDHGEDAP